MATTQPPSPPPVLFWMGETELSGGRIGVVEVIQEEVVVQLEDGKTTTEHRYTVLCSNLIRRRLQCVIGFSNDPVHCEAMTTRGFTFIEGLVVLEPKTRELTVRAAAFTRGATEIDYECELLRVSGFAFDAPGVNGSAYGEYLQAQVTPDLVMPADYVRVVPIHWELDRRNVKRCDPSKAKIWINTPRWPPTLTPGPHDLKRVWRGTIAPHDQAIATPGRNIAPPHPTTAAPDKAIALPMMSSIWTLAKRDPARREKRPAPFGSSRSCFRDIEVLGFRLDVPRFDEPDERRRTTETRQDRQEQEFYKLIWPLNFHLPSKRGPSDEPDRIRPDFHYRPATSGLTIELLRYGRMGIPEPLGEMTPDDFQSQHELLVRTVVGRIDEDAAQAQEVATFVPAIFVDNTWSKFMGRYYTGLDKRLAYFCVRDGDAVVPLSPRDAAGIGDPPPLSSIVEVRLAPWVLPEAPDEPAPAASAAAIAAADATMDRRRELMSMGPLLLEIACDPELISGWDDFKLAPTDSVLRNAPLAPRRWRQEDFDDADVRRDFARAAGVGSLGSFQGVQSSPLPADPKVATWDSAEERLETQTWIAARYSLAGSAMMARPRGDIKITLHRIERRPGEPPPVTPPEPDLIDGWGRLCDLLNIEVEDEKTGAGKKSFVFGPGSWYRLLQDMDLAVENGVE